MSSKASNQLWAASFPITQDQARPLLDQLEETLNPAPLSLSSYETETANCWMVEALFDELIEPEIFTPILTSDLLNGLTIKPLPQENWVEKSLENLKPIRVGQFYIYGHHNEPPPHSGTKAIRINAGQAFGTGHHATTIGCLHAIETILKNESPCNVLDLGCGTGILAFAVANLSSAHIVASDNDPIAIQVAQEVAKDNALAQRIEFVTAQGFRHRTIETRHPYDLILANILARPLVALAVNMKHQLAPGGTVVLSGLLATQEQLVLNAYLAQGFRLKFRVPLEEWMTLVLKR